MLTSSCRYALSDCRVCDVQAIWLLVLCQGSSHALFQQALHMQVLLCCKSLVIAKLCQLHINILIFFFSLPPRHYYMCKVQCDMHDKLQLKNCRSTTCVDGVLCTGQ